jgi:hypothetical protein
VTDSLNQVGKTVAKSAKTAQTAVKKISPDMSMPESARDTYDTLVPFEMAFRVPRKKSRVNAKINFLTTPDIISNCCAGDYCMVCQQFLYTELVNGVMFNGTLYNHVLYLDYPYQPGSAYIVDPNVVMQVNPATGLIDGIYEAPTDMSSPTFNTTLLGTSRLIEISPPDGMVSLAYNLPSGAGSGSLAFVIYYVIYYGEGGV